MKVSINSQLYENVEWHDGIMSFETDMTLGQVEEAFASDLNTNIIVYDGDQEIARYYNKGLKSLSVTGSNPRTVTAEFDITQFSGNVETEIRASIEDSDGAIEELAELVGGLSDLNLPDFLDAYESYKEIMGERVGVNSENIVSWFADMRDLETRVKALEDRVLYDNNEEV